MPNQRLSCKRVSAWTIEDFGVWRLGFRPQSLGLHTPGFKFVRSGLYRVDMG